MEVNQSYERNPLVAMMLDICNYYLNHLHLIYSLIKHCLFVLQPNYSIINLFQSNRVNTYPHINPLIFVNLYIVVK